MGERGYSRDGDRTVDLGPRESTEELESLETEARAALDEGDSEDLQAGIDTHTVRQPPADPLHAQPTQQLPRAKRLSGSSVSKLMTSAAETTSPAEALRLEEVARTRVFLKIAVMTCFAGVVIALATGGDPIALKVVIASCAVTGFGVLWMLHLARDVTTYVPRKAVVPALVIAFGAFGGVYYWGVASPVAAMLTYGIYFFSLGANRGITTAMYILVSVLHAALALAIITGVIQDRGLVNMRGMDTFDQIGVLLVIEFLYLITFITARLSQRLTLDAMSKLEQATRNVAQREAMLAEARAELDRALKIGGPGRYTEQQIGTFRLGVLIGRGGMGEVYEAHSVTDNTEAAVKLLHPSTMTEPTHVQRFLREAETASRLDCPHVVRVLEVGTTGAAIPFLAMERLRGFDLAHQLRRQRKLQLLQAKVFSDQVAIGLEAARTAGIVHRDLKPHNVFFAEQQGQRRWKILDFGVSKVGGSGTLTQGHVVGTPAYMAPEQARGENVDHRADVYSLAAILYRSVTGHPAFTGKDVPSTLYDVVYRVPTQPSMLSQLPADIDRVLAIGLAKEPRHRFATAIQLAQWFAAAVDDGLDPDQRRHGDEIIAKYPWGTRPG